MTELHRLEQRGSICHFELYFANSTDLLTRKVGKEFGVGGSFQLGFLRDLDCNHLTSSCVVIDSKKKISLPVKPITYKALASR